MDMTPSDYRARVCRIWSRLIGVIDRVPVHLLECVWQHPAVIGRTKNHVWKRQGRGQVLQGERPTPVIDVPTPSGKPDFPQVDQAVHAPSSFRRLPKSIGPVDDRV